MRVLTARMGLPPGSEKPLAGLRVLDIGCGGGILSEAIAAYGAHVHGVDVVRRNVEVARIHAEKSADKLTYELASAEVLALRGDQYDVVLNMEVVEHVAELSLFMDACASLVKPGGIMFVATINRTFASWFSAILGAEYLLRWLPRGTHRWRKFPTDIEMENHLTQRGLTVFGRTGVLVNPFTRQFRLSSYRDINYMLAAQKSPALTKRFINQ